MKENNMKIILLIVLILNISTLFAVSKTPVDQLGEYLLGSWEIRSEKYFKDTMYVSNFYKIAPNVFLEEKYYKKNDNGYSNIEGRFFWVFDNNVDLFYILQSEGAENLQYIMRFDEENKICYFLRFSSQNLEDLKKVQKGLLSWDAISNRAILKLKFDGEQIIPIFEKYTGDMVFNLRFSNSIIVKSTQDKVIFRDNSHLRFNEKISNSFEKSILKISSRKDILGFTHTSKNLFFLIFYKGMSIVNFPSFCSKQNSSAFNVTINSFYISTIKSSDPVLAIIEENKAFSLYSINDTPVIIWRKRNWNIERSIFFESRYFVGIKEGNYWVFYSTKDDSGNFDRELFNRNEDKQIISLKEGLIPFFKVNFLSEKLDIILAE